MYLAGKTRYNTVIFQEVVLMFEWIKANLATLLISAALAAAVVLVIIKMIRDRKKGRTSCGCGCADCPMSGKCHKK